MEINKTVWTGRGPHKFVVEADGDAPVEAAPDYLHRPAIVCADKLTLTERLELGSVERLQCRPLSELMGVRRAGQRVCIVCVFLIYLFHNGPRCRPC